MTRLLLLSCALLVACGGSKQTPEQTFDLAGIDLYGKTVTDSGMVVTTDLSCPFDGGCATGGDMTAVDMTPAPTGPTITVNSPTAATATTQVNVDVTITDSGSTVQASNVVCSILKTGDTPLTVKGTNPLELTATVVFSNYNPVLQNGVVITIDATDDAGLKTTKAITFTVDTTGPVISMIVPAQGAFIGHATHVSANIVDVPSGVDPTKVFATFTGNSAYQIPLTNTGMDTYEGDFDATRLGKNFILPTLTIRAVDTIGNASNVSYQLKADNSQPWLTLDSPKMRVSQINAEGQVECSAEFLPLGNAIHDPYNPGTDAQLLTIRARVEDQANSASGQTIHYVSGINSSTVRLIAIPAPPDYTDTNGLPPIIAVDEDGDGYCDTINPVLKPVMPGNMATTPQQYLAIGLNQLSIGGTADFRLAANTAGCDSAGDCCDVVGDSSVTTAPAALCPSVAKENFTYVLTYTEGNVPSIWSIGDVMGGTDDSCGGEQFDDLNLLPEGWACFAAMSSDNVGNLGISAPLRACIRRTSMTNHPCDSTLAPPNCTGTYNTMTTTLSGATCTPYVFPEEYRPLPE